MLTYKSLPCKFKTALLASLVSAMSLSATAAPVNSLDLSDIRISSPDIEDQIIPSNRTLVEQQVSAYEQQQLTPQQMEQLKRLNLATERQRATPYVNLPTPIVRSLAVSLEPGKTPPIIRMASNMLTTINFVDANGDPWPIESVSLNRSQFDDSITLAKTNPGAMENGGQGGRFPNQGQYPMQGQYQDPNQDPYSAQGQNQNGGDGYNPYEGQTDPRQQQMQMYSGTATQQQPEKTNILTLFPKQPVAYSNVAITLEGKPLPVIFLLASGQPEVDIRVDARISGVSPNSKRDRVTTGYVANLTVDEDSLSILDGVIPSDANSLSSSNNNVQAWEYNDELYVRTTLDVFYPEYTSRVGSRGGSRVYKFNGNPTNVVFTQRNGQPLTVSFENNVMNY